MCSVVRTWMLLLVLEICEQQKKYGLSVDIPISQILTHRYGACSKWPYIMCRLDSRFASFQSDNLHTWTDITLTRSLVGLKDIAGKNRQEKLGRLILLEKEKKSLVGVLLKKIRSLSFVRYFGIWKKVIFKSIQSEVQCSLAYISVPISAILFCYFIFDFCIYQRNYISDFYWIIRLFVQILLGFRWNSKPYFIFFISQHQRLNISDFLENLSFSPFIFVYISADISGGSLYFNKQNGKHTCRPVGFYPRDGKNVFPELWYILGFLDRSLPVSHKKHFFSYLCHMSLPAYHHTKKKTFFCKCLFIDTWLKIHIFWDSFDL